MASVEKYTQASVVGILRHNNREIVNNSNIDIDPSLTYLNYELTPEREMSHYQYFKKRKSELYAYGRKDLKVLASWVVTAPKELESKEDIDRFFEVTFDFLAQKYRIENVIQATVHFDEGKREKIRDRWTNEVIRDEFGKPVTELVKGRPHLHFSFIPSAPDNNSKHVQKEKICANDVLTRKHLKTFHGELQEYLDKRGVKASVITGITKEKGRNMTVDELKERYMMEKELAELREFKRIYEHNYSYENERNRWS